MFKLRREKLLVPGIFTLYIPGAALAIIVFRLIFPDEAAPLPNFSGVWRFLGGIAAFINLFPALALSALVIPFGVIPDSREKFAPFSQNFLKNISASVFCAIAAAAIYAPLFLLALPVVSDKQADLRSQGLLYRLSAEQARSSAAENDWAGANRFLAICGRIWPDGPDLEGLRIETTIRLGEISLSPGADDNAANQDALPDIRSLTVPAPVSAAEALALAETALADERYFDAHWLATLGGELAPDGSVEAAEAGRLASTAWNAVTSLEPNARESESYRIYHLKRSAYRALLARDWIQAYYLFDELLALSPRDPDGLHYINVSRQGLERMAFFIDEMELREGPAGALFSLPIMGEGNLTSGGRYISGRLVLRFASLSVSPDSAYGMGLEALAFDWGGRLLWRLAAPYCKITPLSLESGPNVLILMRALDKSDGNLRREPEIEEFAGNAPANAQLSLDLSWQDFTLLSGIRRPRVSLGPAELLAASRLGAEYGYVPQIFGAELIGRFAEPVMLLPLLVFGIAVGWRFRARKRPLYLWVPMLGVLPLVFHGLFNFLVNCLNDTAIWAVVSFGFSFAIVFFGVGFLVLFFASLIVLAAQHG